MMINVPKTEQKRVTFKVYSQIKDIDKTLKTLRCNNFQNLEISILGILDKRFALETEKGHKIPYMENLWIDLTGARPDIDFLYNPEIGNIFIIGFLVPTFLHEVEGKSLGAISIGPYDIFRGLGISLYQTNRIIKALAEGSYLLIVRGNLYESNILEDIINE
ncbi:hypothetical protein [Poritiphilus flavus]|uniref:Uncharacterized protein n=1 Tax=Poritiphilus flavus TaxID=2697053 RepID=A0A6L9EGC8_9FLAO|nr:hypothetical protein [Poritiphilus flavus]NAS13723.1 hypothetical protein [Poritiphilus flavus]